MLDVAIIGGGVCGLALAHSLQARRIDWRLFEARERLGGRVLTEQASVDAGGAALDLGPTWYWPGHQPSMARLVADLGLETFAQADDGRVMHLSDPNRSPDTVAVSSDGSLLDAVTAAEKPQGASLHGGAMRLAGGMTQLVQALAKPLPAHRQALGMVLQTVVNHGDFVELRFLQGEQAISVQARRVVLALPPRLVESSLHFEPALPEGLAIALRATPTWMATAAKAAFAYPRAFWKEAGHTGNAWITHPQAVLAEVFDASGPSADKGAALAGFLAQGAKDRQSFEAGMDLLLSSQVGQLFGLEAQDGELHRTDWALQPYTCSPLDWQDDGQVPAHGHHAAPDPVIVDALTSVWWSGRLFFGGSETARLGAGYLEGALSAAARLRRDLLAQPAETGTTPVGPQEAMQLAASVIAQAAQATLPKADLPDSPEAPAASVAEVSNEASLQSFSAWVAGERSQALQRYRSRLNQALSRQDDLQLTQKAVLGALESLYDDALTQLDALPLVLPAQPDEQGRAALTPEVLAPFKGLADELLTEVVRFNNTSCALSNFPYEHKPPRDYLQTIRRDLAATWQAFALAANERLLAKARLAAAPGALA